MPGVQPFAAVVYQNTTIPLIAEPGQMRSSGITSTLPNADIDEIPARLFHPIVCASFERAVLCLSFRLDYSSRSVQDLRNLFYVGSRDLASYLVVTPAGNILIDANLEVSPALIRASVEKLGFRWGDIKVLLNSQAHYDHVGGSAQVIAETGALQMVMEGDADVIETGGATEYDRTLHPFPPSRVDRILHDGDTVTVGNTTLTAHKTAGHTRGCTTWTMETHEGGRILHVVIVGGWALNPGLLLIPGHGKPAAYPNIASDFDRTFATLKALPCDIFLGAHGLYFDFLAKLERLPREGPSVWVDPKGYRDAVMEMEGKYRKEYARQKAGGLI